MTDLLIALAFVALPYVVAVRLTAPRPTRKMHTFDARSLVRVMRRDP